MVTLKTLPMKRQYEKAKPKKLHKGVHMMPGGHMMKDGEMEKTMRKEIKKKRGEQYAT